jgi:sensor histidine kinase YesM
MNREQNYRLSDRNVKFEYASSIKFPLLETFEQSTEFSSIDADGVNMFITTEDDRTIGKITLQDTVTYFDVKSPKYYLEGSGNFTFWEMEYKCDNNIDIQLFITTSTGTISPASLVSLRPTNGEWKKIYINLTSTLTNYTTTAALMGVELVMTGNRLSNNNVTNFCFDNIKLITFE